MSAPINIMDIAAKRLFGAQEILDAVGQINNSEAAAIVFANAYAQRQQAQSDIDAVLRVVREIDAEMNT